MKRFRIPQFPRQIWVLLVLALLILTALFAWLMQGPVREYLVELIAERVWQLQNMGRMLPQAELWLGLIVLGAANAVFFFVGRSKLQFQRPPVPPLTGRVGYWLGTLRVGRRARRLLIRPLRALAIQVVAHGEQLSRDEVLSHLQGQTLPIPVHLQAYLNDRRFRPPPAREDDSPQDHLPYEPELEEIVRILEDYLEVSHES